MRPWVYKFAVDIDLANAAKMLGTSCFDRAPGARALIFICRRFGRPYATCVLKMDSEFTKRIKDMTI